MPESNVPHSGAAGAQVPASAPTSSSPNDGQFALQGDIQGHLNKARLDQWAQLYGTKHRQIYRWIERGREKSDPCPLDNPRAMVPWIDRNLEKIRGDLRERVAQAAHNAPLPSATTAPAPGADTSITPIQAAQPLAPLPDFQSFDLASVGGIEGEQVIFFRQLFAATKIHLQDAYRDGPESKIPTLHKRLESIGTSLIKHEKAAELKARAGGAMITREEYTRQLSDLITLFKQLREHRAKSVLAEIPDAPPEVKARVTAAIDKVTLREEQVFCDLGRFKSSEDVHFALVA